MKKIKVVLASLTIATLTLTSCSSDDSSGTSVSIVGKWNPIKTVIKSSGSTITQDYDENEAGCAKDFIEFVEGGVLRNVIYFKNAENACTEDAAEPEVWAKTDDELTITGGEYDGTYEITKLSGSELRVTQTESLGGTTATVTVYFKKAASTN